MNTLQKFSEVIWTDFSSYKRVYKFFEGILKRRQIQMKLILLCVWAEWAVLDSAKTALKFKYEI